MLEWVFGGDGVETLGGSAGSAEVYLKCGTLQS